MRYVLIVLLTFFLIGCEKKDETIKSDSNEIFEEEGGAVFNIEFIYNRKVGLFTTDGKMLIEPIYDYIFVEQDSDYFLFKANKKDMFGLVATKEGVIGKNAEIAIEPRYDFLIWYDDIKHAIIKENSGYGVMDINENYLFAPYYDFIYFTPDKKYIVVTKRFKDSVYDFNKNRIIDENHDRIRAVLNHNNNTSEYVYTVQKDDKFGIISKNGSILIEPKYEYLHGFKNDEAIFTKDGKYGVIDRDENVLLEPIYEELMFSNIKGFYIIKKVDKFGFININKEIVVQPFYDNMEGFQAHNIAVAKQGKQDVFFAFLDGKIKEIKKDEALMLEAAFYDMPIVKFDNAKNLYGYIDKNGDWVIKPELKSAYPFSKGGYALVVSKDQSVKVINTKGRVVLRDDIVCKTKVIKNAKGEIIYPQKTKEELCKK
ncbi:MAG: WG repeat-containing protein [Campylobacteraceae bacterium]